MKKLLILAIMGLFVVSCSKAPTACECEGYIEEINKQMKESDLDVEKLQAIKERWKDKYDACEEAAKKAGDSWECEEDKKD